MCPGSRSWPDAPSRRRDLERGRTIGRIEAAWVVVRGTEDGMHGGDANQSMGRCPTTGRRLVSNGRGASMSASSRHVVLSYGIAAAGMVVAGLSPWWLTPLFGNSGPMRLILVAVVTCSAWMGGRGPGLFATPRVCSRLSWPIDMPGDTASLLTRLWRFGPLGLLITAAIRGDACPAPAGRDEGAGVSRAARAATAAWSRPRVRASGRSTGTAERSMPTLAWARSWSAAGPARRPAAGGFPRGSPSDPRNWLDPPEGTPVWHEVRFQAARGR